MNPFGSDFAFAQIQTNPKSNSGDRFCVPSVMIVLDRTKVSISLWKTNSDLLTK